MSANLESASGPWDGGDLLVRNIGRLLTLGGYRRPRRGRSLLDLGVQDSAAVLIERGIVTEVGPEAQVVREARGVDILDAGGRLVLPGLVDAHSHAAFVGSRAGELVDRLKGKSYREIAREGGGILRTVRAVRAASEEEIVEETVPRLRRMIAHGTTTAEVKSGYGLDGESETKMLAAIARLNDRVPITLVPTFLGAHAIPPEFASDAEGYVDTLVDTLIPAVADQGLARYCDVFVESGFFNPEQGRRILMAGQEAGLPSKVHADELTASGGAELAADVQAVSADHLLFAGERGLNALAESGTLAVVLPGTSFSLFDLPYADARRMIETGVSVALGTDLSPNAWIESMLFVISLACYRLRMRPEEAVSAATWNAAWAVGLASVVGSVEPGKRGDLVVLEARDVPEIPYGIARNLAHTVIKDGAVVSRKGRLTPGEEPG
ncbi:MAG: imidazolonepropionase [Candidatus Thermoplasmatota archaeon]|nr:imidazolonepropionase [Candidatus Thermoplasmatota archaeon]